jgi:hypothetical protein
VAAAVGALCGVALIGVWMVARRGTRPPTVITTPVAAAPAPAALPTIPVAAVGGVAALPPIVHLRVDGASGAELDVDGRLVGQLPVDVELPRRSEARQLVVHRHGYASWTRTIAGDTSITLTATIRRRQAAAAPAPAPAASSPGIYNPFDRH